MFIDEETRYLPCGIVHRSLSTSKSMKHWYALKVFYNRYAALRATFARDGVESYVPMKMKAYPQPNGEVVEREVPMIAMLMFFRCEEEYVQEINQVLCEKAMIYHKPGTQVPAAIPDNEMNLFIRLTTLYSQGFEAIPYNEQLITGGVKYRVVEGEYSGAEGYYKRVRRNRCLVVPLSNLFMIVSTGYIPQRFLEEIG